MSFSSSYIVLFIFSFLVDLLSSYSTHHLKWGTEISQLLLLNCLFFSSVLPVFVPCILFIYVYVVIYFCSIYFRVLLLGSYKSIIIMNSRCIDPFIIIKYSSLSLLIFVFKLILSDYYSHFSSLLDIVCIVYLFLSFYFPSVSVFKSNVSIYGI